jgi:hypothetical protein
MMYLPCENGRMPGEGYFETRTNSRLQRLYLAFLDRPLLSLGYEDNS